MHHPAITHHPINSIIQLPHHSDQCLTSPSFGPAQARGGARSLWNRASGSGGRRPVVAILLRFANGDRDSVGPAQQRRRSSRARGRSRCDARAAINVAQLTRYDDFDAGRWSATSWRSGPRPGRRRRPSRRRRVSLTRGPYY